MSFRHSGKAGVQTLAAMAGTRMPLLQLALVRHHGSVWLAMAVYLMSHSACSHISGQHPLVGKRIVLEQVLSLS